MAGNSQNLKAYWNRQVSKHVIYYFGNGASGIKIEQGQSMSSPKTGKFRTQKAHDIDAMSWCRLNVSATSLQWYISKGKYLNLVRRDKDWGNGIIFQSSTHSSICFCIIHESFNCECLKFAASGKIIHLMFNGSGL